MKKTPSFFKRLRNQSGATLTEYALIVAFIIAVLFPSFVNFEFQFAVYSDNVLALAANPEGGGSGGTGLRKNLCESSYFNSLGICVNTAPGASPTGGNGPARNNSYTGRSAGR